MLGVGFGMISKRLLFKGNFCENAPYTSRDLGNPLKSQETRLPSMLERALIHWPRCWFGRQEARATADDWRERHDCGCELIARADQGSGEGVSRGM